MNNNNIFDIFKKLHYLPVSSLPKQCQKPINDLLLDDNIQVFGKYVQQGIKFFSEQGDELLWTTDIYLCGYVVVDGEEHVLDTFCVLLRPFFIRNKKEHEAYNEMVESFFSEFAECDTNVEINGHEA